MANIRDQDSWVHMNEPEKALEKAKELVQMSVARVTQLEPLEKMTFPVTKAALVIGGGVAGMEAAAAPSRTWALKPIWWRRGTKWAVRPGTWWSAPEA